MTAEKASLNLVAQLMQDMAAKRDPITAKEVNTFRERPSGPIIPDRCVSIERFRPLGKVAFIAADPNGEPWICFKNADSIFLHWSTALYCLEDDSWAEDIIGQSRTSLVDFIGKVQPGYQPNTYRPLIRIGYAWWTKDDDRKEIQRRQSYWLGDKQVLDKIPGRIEAVVRTNDGFIVSFRREGGTEAELRHLTKLEGGKAISIRVTTHPFTQLAFDAKTDTVYGARVFPSGEHGALKQTVENALTGKIIEKGAAEPHPQELIANNEGVWLAQYANGGNYRLWRITPEGLTDDTLLRDASGVAMMGSIPVSRITRRHGRSSWRFYRTPLARAHTPNRFFDPVTEVTDPGFDVLSDPFQKNGAWFYYGLAGDHLCLMEVPELRAQKKRSGARLLSETTQPEQVKRLF